MESKKHKKIVQAWIECNKAEKGSNKYKDNFWAANKLMELESTDPELLWKLIISILEKDTSDKIISNLAAGPLEGLLAHHGKEFIDRIEEKAKNNSDFRNLLEGVWQNIMPADIWQRVEKARKV